MVLNPFLEQRKRNKSVLLDILIGNPDLPEKKLIAIFCLKTGLREKTALEYLKELKDSGLLEDLLKRQATLSI